MTDIKKHILILSLVLFSFSIFGQGAGNSMSFHPWQIKNFAKNAIRVGDIYTAIDYLEVYTQLKPENYKEIFMLAELYRKSRDYVKAEKWYLKAYRGDEKKYIKALYYHALMQKMNGKYDLASQNFIKFRKKCKGLKDARLYKKLAQNEVRGCEIAPILIDSSLKVLITHLDTSVNKAHIDFAPVSINEQTMLYSSLKADKIKYYNPNDTLDKIPVRKFYLAKKHGENWKNIGEFEGPFNDPEINSGNGAFSPDGMKFYFTRSEKNWQNKVISKIYVSEKFRGKWTEPEKMPEPINNPKYTTTQPTIGIESVKNEEVMYFVSDRPGGKGGLDIWFTIYNKKKKSFKLPKNAGSKINTIGDEMSPYYDMETRKMFFSSTGHPGIGGYDIFKSTGEVRRWTQPENIGYPINSQADDVYYAVNKDRERAFFVSNREGGVSLKNSTCCDDIYGFRWTEYIHIAVKGPVFEMVNLQKVDTLIQYIERITDTLEIDTIGIDSLNIDSLPKLVDIVIEIDTSSVEQMKMLNDADVTLYLVELEDDIEETYLVKSMKARNAGNYIFALEQGNNYRLIAECDGYFNTQADISTTKIITSDTLEQALELKKIPIKAIVLENIYYEFDKADLTENAKTTIDSTILMILKDNPKLIVELSSHTDSKGDDDYNLKLSQERAESVVNYLIIGGIEKKRLIATGYGEIRPVAPNTNPNGSDNPEGRQENRRTEFKVIGSSDQFSKLNQSKFTIKSGEGVKTFNTKAFDEESEEKTEDENNNNNEIIVPDTE